MSHYKKADIADQETSKLTNKAMKIPEQLRTLIDSKGEFGPLKTSTNYALAYGEAYNLPYDQEIMGSCLVAYTGLVVELGSDEQALIIFHIILLEALQDTSAGIFWKWIRNELTFETLVARIEDRDDALRRVLSNIGEITDEILDSHNRRKDRFSSR